MIRDEVIKELGFTVYKNISYYTTEQLSQLIDKIKERHDEIVGIPLRKEIHILFHKVYGKTNTTMDDLIEFKARYLAGEFEGRQTESQQLSLII